MSKGSFLAVGYASPQTSAEELIGYVKRIKKVPGCRTVKATQDLVDQSFMVYMEFDSQPHFIAFLKTQEDLPGLDLNTLWEAGRFAAPGLARKADAAWARAEKKDLTKKDGKLFFLSEDGRTRHALFNNTADQYDVQMRFPKQAMKPATDDVTQCDDDTTKFKATIFPGATIPFVNGKWNGGYGLSFSWGPVSDPRYLEEMWKRIDGRVMQEVESFKRFLRDQGVHDDLDDARVTRSYAFQKKAFDKCKQHHEKYVDLSFLPTQTSIDRAGGTKRGWMRPQEYLKEEHKEHFELVKGKLEPADIDQGALGDCWFMAAIAACAEMPDMLIKPMFADYNKQMSQQERDKERSVGRDIGAFRVHLAKNGWWRWHIVDTFLPVLPVDDPGAPIFAKNKEEPAEMWVAILEKVYAKLHSSYQDLAGGDPAVALSDLTGFPCITFADWPEQRRNLRTQGGTEESRDSWNQLFKMVLHHDGKERMLWVTTPGVDTTTAASVKQVDKVKAEKYEEVGLVSGHAYTVLAAVDLKDGPHGNTRLVMIRNPWGGGKEWNKDWSDDDPKWQEYPHIAKLCVEAGQKSIGSDYKLKSADGTFWMDWDDVREYFDSGGVCLKSGKHKVQEQWQDVRFRTSFSDGLPFHFVRLVPSANCKCLAFVSQHDKRGLKAGDARENQAALRLDVITPNPERPKMHTTIATSNKGVFMYAHQALAVDVKQDGADDFDEEFDLKKGVPYYFIVRQHPQEKNEYVRNRGGIALTIQTSPGTGGGGGFTKVRGFSALAVTDSFVASCKYKGYYGFTDTGAAAGELNGDDSDVEGDESNQHTAVQLDGTDRGTDGKLLRPDESNWPASTCRWPSE